jgi:hypothetical protein
MVAIDVEMKEKTAAIDTVGIAQPKTLTAGAIETTTAVIAEDDRETAQDKSTDHSLQIPSDEGTPSQSHHLPPSRVALYHHRTINFAAS